MNKNTIFSEGSPGVGKSLREIYDLNLNKQYVDYWAAIEPHPKSMEGVKNSPVLAISQSIDDLVEFCNSREYLANVTYEPIRAEKPDYWMN